MRNPLSLSLLALALGATPALAQTSPSDEVVVTASRSGDGVRKDLLGASETTIGAQDMTDRQVVVVSDVLRDVPGVAISRGGPAGQITDVRIRGSEANHSLTLIDGVEASDPFQGQFDYSTLIADDVARIEVLRGQQSALYGSTAIGGVISYITATGGEAPGLSGRLEGGSFGAANATVRFGGVSGPLDYVLSAAGTRTDGTVGAAGGVRKDGYDSLALAAKAGFKLSDSLSLRGVLRYSDTHADTVDQDFNFPPAATYGRAVDGNGEATNRSLIGLLGADLVLLDGRWKTSFSAQGVDAKRRAYNAGALSSGSDGTRIKESVVSTVRLERGGLASTLTFAFDNRRETYLNIPVGAPTSINTKRTLNNTGYVAEYDGAYGEHFGFGAAIRHDQNERFQNADTYRVQASYRFDSGFRIRAASGSGIAAPTNFELFGFDPTSFVGNPNLKPEKSQGWEAGLDWSAPGLPVRLGVTYYDDRLTDEIYTKFLPGFLSAPDNQTTPSYQRGVELTASANLPGGFEVDAQYAHLKATENGGLPEVRRPNDSGSVNLTWRAEDRRISTTLSVRYTGGFVDFDFTDPFAFVTPRRAMPGFTVVNLAGSWRLTDKVALTARVENLFDAKYQEQFTFQGQGVSGFVGVKAAF